MSIQIYSPALDEMLLTSIADLRIDATLIPEELEGKVLNLVTKRIGLDKFSTAEKIVLLASMGINTYIYTVKKGKDKSVTIVKDLLPSLSENYNHRVNSAIQKLTNVDTVVLSDKDVVRYMEAIYFVQNKSDIVALAKDYTNLKTSKLWKQKELNDTAKQTIDRAVDFVSKATLLETKMLIELKVSRGQYKLLMFLYSKGATLFSEVYKHMEGSAKKRNSDYRELEQRNLVTSSKLDTRKTLTSIITAQGRLSIFNAITKYL